MKISTLSLLLSAHSISGYQPELGAMFQEDAARILLGVDPDTVVSDDGAAKKGSQLLRLMKIIELFNFLLIKKYSC